MEIRAARPEELGRILEIYDTARQFMRAHGNSAQWINGYPQSALIEGDIAAGASFVCQQGGRIVGVFAFFTGEEPSYRVIEEGNWLDEAPYGVLHRLGSDGTVRGVGRFCLKWCFSRCGNLRVDTHRNNVPMQKLLESEGFVRCGLIHIEDGSERVAFQKNA